MHTTQRRLRIGLLGCGPSAQAAYLDALSQAHNADLYAICDVAQDHTYQIARMYQPRAVYTDVADLLADPQLDAVVIAVADQFHVPLAHRALAARKPVLLASPLRTSVEEAESLRSAVATSGCVLQIGNSRRFTSGIIAAQRIVRDELGAVLAVNAWYYGSLDRHTLQDNLIDAALFLAGPIASVTARRRTNRHMHGWSIDVDFASGAMGHLELIGPREGDFEEGFRVHCEHGSVSGREPLPGGPHQDNWLNVKRQVEDFADAILHGTPQIGTQLDEGIAALRTAVAISHSVAYARPVATASVSGAVLPSARLDAHPRRHVPQLAAA